MAKPPPVYTPRDLLDHDAIAAVVRDKDGKLLMFFHTKFQLWTIPIGKAEADETPYEGMCSELREECGIVVKKADEIASKPFTYKRDGKDILIILHLYAVHEFEGIPANREPHKHPIMKFMSEEEIRTLKDLSDSTLLFLDITK